MSNLRRNRGELIRALTVDDEADIRELLDMTLPRMGLAADSAGSVAAALLAVQNGASIVRVHDVKETVDALKVLQALKT